MSKISFEGQQQNVEKDHAGVELEWILYHNKKHSESANLRHA